MILNPTQRSMRDTGCLVYAIDQSLTPPMMQPGPWGVAGDRAKGYCAGLALRWIKLRCRGKDYPCHLNTFENTLECELPGWKATRDQNIFDDGRGPEAVLAQYGMSMDMSRQHTHTGPVTAQGLLQGVRADGFYFVVMRGSGENGHAMAIQRRSEEYHLFDANHGLFRVQGTPAFQMVFGLYLQSTGYQQCFNAVTRVTGVKEPGLRIDPSLLSSASDSPPGSPIAQRRRPG